MQSGLNTQQQNVLDQLLMEAVGNRDLDHVKLYVEKGANVNMNTGYQYHELQRNGNRVPLNRQAPLFHFMYAKGFHRGIADYLIEKGVDVDARDALGNTVLMLAAKQGDLDAVNYFVSKGADPMASNNAGEIVLEEARGLQAYYTNNRQPVIDALVAALPSVGGVQQQAPRLPSAELPAPAPETALQKRLNNRFNP